MADSMASDPATARAEQLDHDVLCNVKLSLINPLRGCTCGLAERLRAALAANEQELRLNAQMLAKQCDLARDAENRTNKAAGQCDGCGVRWALGVDGDPLGDAFCAACYRNDEALRVVAREMIAHYTKAGGCGNCGGAVHSTNCWIGRMITILGESR